MSNMTDLWLSGVFVSSSKYTKIRFRPGLRPGTAGELTTLPLTTSRLGHPLPIPFLPRRLRRFGCLPPNTNFWLRLWLVSVRPCAACAYDPNLFSMVCVCEFKYLGHEVNNKINYQNMTILNVKFVVYLLEPTFHCIGLVNAHLL